MGAIGGLFNHLATSSGSNVFIVIPIFNLEIARALEACSIWPAMGFTSIRLPRYRASLASSNPARKLGIENVGELKIGHRANIILFTLEHHEMKIRKTFLDGSLVYRGK